MCGPVAGLVVTDQSKSKSDLFLYNFFRLLGYVLVGGIIAVAGSSFMDYFGKKTHSMLAIALLTYSLFTIAEYFKKVVKDRNLRLTEKLHACGSCKKCEIKSLPFGVKPTVIGFFTVFIPCISLTPALLLASQLESFLGGATVMFIFGLGTLPVMSGGGMVAKKILKYTPRVFHDLFHPASCLIVAVWSIFVLV